MPGPFPFKQILAADPSSPAMVARNGEVLLFAPGDTAMTPLVIWDLSHTIQLPNPITVNDLGFGPAFIHDTLDQVAWSGGGLSGTFESYRGMKDVATAAEASSEASATSSAQSAQSALDAADNAATAAADGVQAQLAATAQEATDAKAAAQQAAQLVDAPADTVTAALVGNPASATGAALSAAIVQQTVAKVDKDALKTAARLASIPAPYDAFPLDAQVLPKITNTNSPSGTLSKVWAATFADGPLAWHGPISVRTGGSGGVASDMPHGAATKPSIVWEWVTDEPLIAINATFGNGAPHIIIVDGQLVTTGGAIQGTNTHQTIDWLGVRKLRHYKLAAGSGFDMISIKTTTAGTVFQPPMEMRPVCAFFTDSYGMGAAATGQLPTHIPYLVGELLGWRMRTAADGGTGYQNDGVSGGSRVSGHIPDLNGVKLDAAIFAHGLNDATAGEQDAVTSTLNLFKAAHPDTPMYVVGPWQPSTTWASANTARTAAVKAGALAAGAFYVDNDGWVFGTGKVGATTGDGNADVYISSDGTHLQFDTGKPYTAVRLADALKKINADAIRSL